MKDTNQYHLVYMGEDILSEVASPVSEITPEIKALVEHMQEIMYRAGGCGIAAPQVGASLRICIVDCEWDESAQKHPYVLINPEIVEVGEEVETHSEGCLSFPGASVKVTRPSKVVVEALNLEGDVIRYSAESSLLARCLQHEIDHLDGKVLLDYAGPMARMSAVSAVKRSLTRARELNKEPWEIDAS